MEVIIGKTSGFCYGVKNAVDKAKEELQNSSESLYCLGELVHNKQVTNILKENGLVFIEDIEQAKGKTIIRAHGIKKEIYQKAKKLNIELKDLTCPKVLKIHDIVEQYSNNGYYIFLVGISNHPETIGTYSFCGENCSIIEKISDLEQIVENFRKTNIKKALLITQTTFNFNEFEKIAEKLQEMLDVEQIELKVINSICSTTELRQKEAEKLSQEVELMIIIGGRNSSNTKKLYDISLQNCKNVIFAETKEDIDIDYIKQFEKIGVMAGASTPYESIENVVKLIQEKE